MSAYEIYSPEADEAAFAAVYRAHSQKLLRYCQYRLRDRHEAEDVVQEAFARAWRTMPSTNSDNFYPWLRVVAGNLCTDVLRKRSRSEPHAVIDLGAVDGGMDRIAEESERVLVRQALGRLNDRHRSALMMREDEGLTYDQIARRTGVTPGTVESLLWRARQALRREFTVLAGREGTLAVAPFLPLLLIAKLRHAGRRSYLRLIRRSYLRLIRRVPALDPSSDTPLAHAAVAAFAAISVATGVVATITMGGQGNHPAVIVPAQTSPANTTSVLRAVPPPAAGPVVPSSGGPAPAPSASSSATVTGTGGAGGQVPTTAGSATQAPPPLRVVNPVTVGHAAATQAQNSPVTIDTGVVTVGASPPVATQYLQEVQKRVTTPVTSVTNHALKENQP